VLSDEDDSSVFGDEQLRITNAVKRQMRNFMRGGLGKTSYKFCVKSAAAFLTAKSWATDEVASEFPFWLRDLPISKFPPAETEMIMYYGLFFFSSLPNIFLNSTAGSINGRIKSLN
jgi:hypothetical protein